MVFITREQYFAFWAKLRLGLPGCYLSIITIKWSTCALCYTVCGRIQKIRSRLIVRNGECCKLPNLCMTTDRIFWRDDLQSRKKNYLHPPLILLSQLTIEKQTLEKLFACCLPYYGWECRTDSSGNWCEDWYEDDPESGQHFTGWSFIGEKQHNLL